MPYLSVVSKVGRYKKRRTKTRIGGAGAGGSTVSRTKYSYGDNWDKTSKQVRKEHNYRCSECGWKPRKPENKRFIHAHHEKPISKGGTNNTYNLSCICLECHASEHAHMKKNKLVLFFKKNKHWL